jgi:hypothetical protein
MCDVFQGIHQAVGVVIAGVDAPGVAGMGVMRKLDSVGYEVPHDSHIVLVIATHPASPSHALHFCFSILYLTVWGVEPVVTHQTSWLESLLTGLDCSQPQALPLIFH